MSKSNVSRGDSAYSVQRSDRQVVPQKLRNTSGDESDKWFAQNLLLNLFCVFCAFACLYGFYAFFFWFWLTMLKTFGQQLLWFYFGLFLTTFGGMAIFTIYSMSRQKIGWWAPQPAVNNASVLCGYALY